MSWAWLGWFFVCEKPFFGFGAASVLAGVAVGADDAVTGQEERERVGGACGGCGADSCGVSCLDGELGVGEGGSVGDGGEVSLDGASEGRAHAVV